MPDKLTKAQAGRLGGKVGGKARVPKGFAKGDNAKKAINARWERYRKEKEQREKAI